jgi:hypothetical protein
MVYKRGIDKSKEYIFSISKDAAILQRVVEIYISANNVKYCLSFIPTSNGNYPHFNFY